MDIDGTLVDSNDAHARAWEAALAQYGHVVPFERIRSLIGKGGDQLLAEAASIDKDSAQGQAIDELRGQWFRRDALPGLKAFPQARELLERMPDRGLELVVATSAKEAENSKPAPDIIEAALRKAGVDPAAALMLGDTPYDVTAAGRGNVQTVALRSGGWKDADLEGALAIYEDAADLLAH